MTFATSAGVADAMFASAFKSIGERTAIVGPDVATSLPPIIAPLTFSEIPNRPSASSTMALLEAKADEF